VREIERLTAGRHELQAAGTHPAPCARHCESTAYEIEIRRLRHDIEHHVRIATDAIQEAEQLRSELAASREREARMRGIGGQLSNVAFNLAQRPGEPLSSDDCSMLDRLRKQWDAALAEGVQG
jgi:hypothetical protein